MRNLFTHPLFPAFAYIVMTVYAIYTTHHIYMKELARVS